MFIGDFKELEKGGLLPQDYVRGHGLTDAPFSIANTHSPLPILLVHHSAQGAIHRTKWYRIHSMHPMEYNSILCL